MIHRRLRIPSREIESFCRRHHSKRLAIFGSALRDDFRADSDIDVLVEFEPGHTPGLAFFVMDDELASLLGREVDLNTSAFLSLRIREKVLAEPELLYAAR